MNGKALLRWERRREQEARGQSMDRRTIERGGGSDWSFMSVSSVKAGVQVLRMFNNHDYLGTASRTTPKGRHQCAKNANCEKVGRTSD